MSRKPYSRTFRYSEETKKILDQYDGNFDELVHYAFFRAAEAEEQLKLFEERKKRIECDIAMLYIKRDETVDILNQMHTLKDKLKSLHERIDKFTEM